MNSPLDALLAALSSNQGLDLATRSRLKAPLPVEPFVAPELEILDGEDFRCDVVFVEAAAAVGKSTLARHVAVQTGAPVLDLSRTRVATDSMAGLLQGIRKPENALQLFDQRELPVVVDGLDEGQLLSGVRNFEEFLSTTWDLLVRNGEPTGPAVVFFGRPETVAFAEVSLQVDSQALESRRCRLDYFRQDAARAMVFAYAEAGSDDDRLTQHQEAAEAVLDAFFNSIARALRRSVDELWGHEDGLRFAGYAPVLATLGDVLAQTTNYSELESRLASRDHNTAWSVVEDVCDSVFDREADKVREPLKSRCSGDIPHQAYDRSEQVRALLARLTDQPVGDSLRIEFSNPLDTDVYREIVATFVAEHPFIRGTNIASDVLGSVLFAEAIRQGLSVSGAESQLNHLSRQPFIWRSFERYTEEQPLIDGDVVGALLSSFRSDDQDDLVLIESLEPSMCSLRLGHDSPAIATIHGPVTLGDRLSNACIRCEELRLRASPSDDRPSIRLVGPLELSTSSLQIDASEVILANSVWLRAEHYVPSGQLRVERADNRAKIGVAGALPETHPWSGVAQTLTTSPFSEENDTDPVAIFLDECASRLPLRAPIVLNADLSPTDDQRIRWAAREYGNKFQELIWLMIELGLASSERFSASGSQKLRVRFEHGWDTMAERVAQGSSEFRDFADRARSILER